MGGIYLEPAIKAKKVGTFGHEGQESLHLSQIKDEVRLFCFEGK